MLRLIARSTAHQGGMILERATALLQEGMGGGTKWPLLAGLPGRPFKAATGIRIRFGARHVARLSDRQILWQGENSGQLGFTRAVFCPNQTISVRFYNGKEGPLQMLEAVPLYCPHYGKWRHMPPRELESPVATTTPMSTGGRMDWYLDG